MNDSDVAKCISIIDRLVAELVALHKAAPDDAEVEAVRERMYQCSSIGLYEDRWTMLHAYDLVCKERDKACEDYRASQSALTEQLVHRREEHEELVKLRRLREALMDEALTDSVSQTAAVGTRLDWADAISAYRSAVFARAEVKP